MITLALYLVKLCEFETLSLTLVNFLRNVIRPACKLESSAVSPRSQVGRTSRALCFASLLPLTCSPSKPWDPCSVTMKMPQRSSCRREIARKTHYNRLRGFDMATYQRAENGALDPWSLDLRLGRPRFLPQIAPKPFKIRVLGPLD